MNPQRTLCMVFLLGAALLASNYAQGQEPLQPLVKNLVRLRSEVDQLQGELDLHRQQHKARMASLATQAGDLENQRNQLDLALKKAHKALQEMRDQVRTAGVSASDLVPIVVEGLHRESQRIQRAFPFKIQERLANVQAIRNRLQAGDLDPWRAANQLWTFIEDELRLTRDNGIYSQTVEIGGDKVLVDVAKLGSVLLYFKTPDKRYGMAQATTKGWKFTVLSGAEQREQIASLFDSLRKQIRQGYFRLPDPLQAIPKRAVGGPS